MKVSYAVLAFLVLAGIGVCSILFPEGVGAIVILVLGSAVVLAALLRNTNDTQFVVRLFFIALGVRILFGTIIYVFQLQDFFGQDAYTYDKRGGIVADYLHGFVPEDPIEFVRATQTSGPGWGMYYLVGIIYFLGGKNMLAAQAFCWVFGAAIGPAVYICAQRVFKNSQVARYAGIATAFFPAFVLWSSQLIKDGLIIFLLVVAIAAVLKLQEHFSYLALLVLILSMFAIMSLRFYIFYMVAIAVVGSFVVGLTNSPGSIIRRTFVLVILGLALTYLGVIRTATLDFEQYANLEQVQRSRLDLAQSGASGFGEDIDVSSAEGAISAIPIGLAYLMLAPFPWQVTNMRQAITLPESILWWAMIPLLIWGLFYTIRHRFREAFPILLFTLMLTLAYSVFQGNVGTAYRQRTQIQVFLFMFIAVGWVLRKEAKENKRIIAQSKRHQIAPVQEAQPH